MVKWAKCLLHRHRECFLSPKHSCKKLGTVVQLHTTSGEN